MLGICFSGMKLWLEAGFQHFQSRHPWALALFHAGLEVGGSGVVDLHNRFELLKDQFNLPLYRILGSDYGERQLLFRHIGDKDCPVTAYQLT